jgi:hypothetical protein
MEHAKLYLLNVGFCTMYISSKWIQLQYGGKHYSNLGPFCVNKLGRMLRNMSLEGANYVQDFRELFFEIEQHHAIEIYLKGYYVHRQNNGMETC